MVEVKRIFLVDDDQDDIAFFQEALLKLPFPTTLSFETDPGRALDILKNKEAKSLDIIFLDFNMPKINGRECAQEIRKMAQYQDTTILLWTTTLFPHKENEIRQAGFENVFLKPNTLEELVTLIIANSKFVPIS